MNSSFKGLQQICLSTYSMCLADFLLLQMSPEMAFNLLMTANTRTTQTILHVA